jgi:hypothetical protein
MGGAVRIVILLLALSSAPALAQPPPLLPAKVPPATMPGVPNPNAERSALEPKVTIRHEKGKEVEEYSIHGQVYMVKVTPKYGPPYYLVDTNGDGRLNARMSRLNPRIMVPQWVLFRW